MFYPGIKINLPTVSGVMLGEAAQLSGIKLPGMASPGVFQHPPTDSSLIVQYDILEICFWQ